MRRYFLGAITTGLLAAAILLGLAASPITQFDRGGSASGQLVYSTNSISAHTVTSPASTVDLSGWFGSLALSFSGVYGAATTNNVIVIIDASFDGSTWKSGWLSWTNTVNGLTTNRTTATMSLDGIGFMRLTITNTAAVATVNAVSVWARYSPKRL